MNGINVDRVVDTLNKKGFKAEYFASAQEARAAVLKLIQPGETVGIGGSMTIYDMQLHQELQEKGHQVFWHWLVPPQERDGIRRKAANADVYLSSTNALTAGGEVVNIDGTGNRVSAMFFGPEKVIIVCGVNKITEDYRAAIDRIKKIACPQNARRLKLNTPCAVKDECNDCGSKDRMCSVTVKIERPTPGKDIRIYIVGESLGY